MDAAKRSMTLLALLSAVLLSLPYLVPHTGFLMLVALVPLLLAERIGTRSGVRAQWRWHYACFVLWNALTTWWVWNASPGGALFAIFANALQMSLVFGLFRFSRRAFRGVVPYLLLALAWLAWERWYLTDAQISWPWLVLGNGFARSTASVQWYEWTGTLGGSLWVWACNLSLFGLLTALADRSLVLWRKWLRRSALAAVAVLFLLPPALSAALYWRTDPSEGEPLRVALCQPNFDPYEKFESLSQEQQNDRLAAQIAAVSGRDDASGPCLILAPETFTGDVWMEHADGSLYSPTLDRFEALLDSMPGARLLMGASLHETFRQAARPSHTARRLGSSLWFESRNSALLLGGATRQVYHKSKLVVGTELMPYPALLDPIDRALGGVCGRCVGQPEVSLLHVGDSVSLGCAVCYESVYGEFCTQYVRKGARLLCVITNDAWWGNTPGYRQHLSYAALRAVETRRSIARCANTGISAFIDARGDIVQAGPWWEPAVLSGQLPLRSGETFFVRHGDVVGRVSTLLMLLLLLALAVRLLLPSSLRS